MAREVSRSWTDAQLTEARQSARSVRDILRQLGLAINGSNAGTVKKHLLRLGLPIPRIVKKPAAQRTKEYRTRNSAKVKLYSKEYQKRNLAKFAQYARNRRALCAGAEGSFTATEFRALCEQYSWKCLACGKHTKKLTADHVQPLSRGGSNLIDNIQPLCSRCNSSKHAKHIDYRSTG